MYSLYMGVDILKTRSRLKDYVQYEYQYVTGFSISMLQYIIIIIMSLS